MATTKTRSRPELTPTRTAKLKQADSVAKSQERGARKTRDDAKAAAWDVYRKKTRGEPTNSFEYRQANRQLTSNLRLIDANYESDVTKIRREHKYAVSKIRS
jgi:hypothetical protein